MKRIKYLIPAIFLSAILSACAPESSGYEARNELKLIRLKNISELSLDDFIVGFGDFADENNSLLDEIGYVLEINIKPDSNIPESCKEILQNDKFPKQIIAYGKYNVREDGRDNYIRQIMISDIVECEAGKKVARKNPKSIFKKALKKVKGVNDKI
jgi:hypothetical protein